MGRSDQFNIQTNQPSEQLWEDDNCRKYFYDTTGLKTREWRPELRGRGDKLAAKWLVKRLRQLIAEDLEEFRARAKANRAKAR